MPDRDVIEVCLRPEWRPTYRILKGSQPLEEAKEALIRSLCAHLRKEGGVPDLSDFVSLIDGHLGGRVSRKFFWEKLLEAEQRLDSRHTSLLARAARQPDVLANTDNLPGAIAERLLGRFLLEVVDVELFSVLEEKGAYSEESERLRVESELIRTADRDLRLIAASLLEYPNASKLRKPPRRRRKSTKELLDSVLTTVPLKDSK